MLIPDEIMPKLQPPPKGGWRNFLGQEQGGEVVSEGKL
jgi:hypothetical protein